MGFKERLKEKRLEAGLTQAELAEKVSVTARTIQNYEMGSRKPGNMKVVGDIATVLGTTPEYLLTSADVYSVEAHQKGGAKAARDIDELVGEVTGLFAGGHASPQRCLLDGQGEEQEIYAQKISPAGGVSPFCGA